MSIRKRWEIGVLWEDRGNCDTDVIVVLAGGESEAIEKATRKWRSTIGAEHPTVTIAQVLPIRAGGRPLLNEKLERM